jgi:signal peptidase II
MFSRYLTLLSIILAACGFDFWTKSVVLKSISPDDVVEVMPFLNFVLRWNSGVSFSFLSNHDIITPTFLLVFNSLIILGLCIWIIRVKEFFIQIPLCLIVGGALGNIVDRMLYGAVVDFIDFHIDTWHFAVFNMGDSFISIGMFLLVVITYIKERSLS